MDIRDLKEVSRAEMPLEYTTTTQGPGGQAYDLAPNQTRHVAAPEPTWTEFAKGFAINYPLALVGAGVLFGLGTGALIKRI